MSEPCATRPRQKPSGALAPLDHLHGTVPPLEQAGCASWWTRMPSAPRSWRSRAACCRATSPASSPATRWGAGGEDTGEGGRTWRAAAPTSSCPHEGCPAMARPQPMLAPILQAHCAACWDTRGRHALGLSESGRVPPLHVFPAGLEKRAAGSPLAAAQRSAFDPCLARPLGQLSGRSNCVEQRGGRRWMRRGASGS
jgi:hypothetical protein